MGDSGQLGNQEEPHDLNRKGLLSQGSNSIAMKSRVNREVQARFCERLEVRPLRPTRPAQENDVPRNTLAAPGRSEMLPVLENPMEMTPMKSCRTYANHSASNSTETSPAPPRLLYSRKDARTKLASPLAPLAIPQAPE